MNKTTLSAIAALSAFFMLAPAHAQTATPSMYAEIGYTQLNYKQSDWSGSLKYSPKAVNGVFGYQFTPNIAVEGLVLLGAGKSKVKVNGNEVGVDGKVKSVVGVFFKPSVSVSESIDLFGRLGWARTETEYSAAGTTDGGNDNGLAYGVGANFNLSKTSYIQANWMNYYKKDGIKIDGFTVAYGFRF